jgi:hypothetical protein
MYRKSIVYYCVLLIAMKVEKWFVLLKYFYFVPNRQTLSYKYVKHVSLYIRPILTQKCGLF